jgi:fatty acid-binding protein DegV
VPVVVVTDSSARLPAAAVAEWGIQVVPLHVLLDGQDLRDGVDAMPADLYQRPQVSTAGASPAELAAAYRSALSGSGGDGVVAVHIAGALSSTLGAAEHAAQQFGGAVQVVEGDWTPERLVVLKFPNLKAARRFEASAEYGKARASRQGAATMRMVIVEGV